MVKHGLFNKTGDIMIDVLKNSVLFSDVSEGEIGQMMGCLTPRQQTYKEGSIIFANGDRITEMGFVLEGSVNVVREDFWGNRSIISHIEKGGFFGEVYAASESRLIDTTVYAAEDATILFLNVHRLTFSCDESCMCHRRLINNFVKVLTQKNIMLMEKINDLSQRSTREKVLSFLSAQAEKAESPYFEIPFSRQEMADYLSVDRSALSKELSKMKAEKIIDFDKNSFRLLQS